MIGRALVVDDDRHILEVVTLRLQYLGLEVTATNDPMKALEAYIYWSNKNSKLDAGRH